MIDHSTSITAKQLARVKLIKPKDAGESWSGIKHSDLLETFERVASDRKWVFGPPVCTLSNNQQEMAASWVTPMRRGEAPNEAFTTFGLRTSNGRRVGLRVYVGFSMCGDDGRWGHYVTYTQSLGRKCVGTLNLETKLGEALDTMSEANYELRGIARELSNAAVVQADAGASIMMEVASRSTFPWSRLSAVRYTAWPKDCTHCTALHLLRAFSDNINRSPGLAQIDQRLAAFDAVWSRVKS